MPKFLLDVNMPYRFSLWNNTRFIHQIDIDDTWTDEQIWKYAKENDLVIITKDADFLNKVLVSEPPPKVIIFKTGNMRLREFYQFISNVWSDIEAAIDRSKCVIVYHNRLEEIK